MLSPETEPTDTGRSDLPNWNKFDDFNYFGLSSELVSEYEEDDIPRDYKSILHF